MAPIGVASVPPRIRSQPWKGSPWPRTWASSAARSAARARSWVRLVSASARSSNFTSTARNAACTVGSAAAGCAEATTASASMALSTLDTFLPLQRFFLGPIGDEALRFIGGDLGTFRENAVTKQRVDVPALDGHGIGIDRHQHLFDLGPMALQGHGIAPRRADLAEADHARDVLAPERGVDRSEEHT